ncbi:MAG: hypothetical protein NVSMB2_20850 [Chloroflexota bacterium]
MSDTMGCSGWTAIGLGALVACVLSTACTAPARAQRPLTYVAIGASDAVGVGAPNPETDGWVPRLASRMGDGVTLVNLGVSGSTLSRALDEQLAPALDAQPDVVTVWLAVNDMNARVPLETYASELDTLLTQLQATHARILVGNVPDLGKLAVYSGIDPILLSAEVDRWNTVIAETVVRHGAQLVDLHARWRELADHPEYISGDGFHPSADGYQRLSDLFAESLNAGA